MTVVRTELQADVAVITIDRPGARNAIDPEVARGIEEAMDLVEGDSAIRVAILTGTAPVFCAGADLRAVGAGDGPLLSTERGGFAGFVRRERTVPVIAAVDGAALAGGFELVLACDLVVASTAARFGLPEVTRGLVASAGGLFRVGRVLPRNLGMQLALTGEPIDAEVAHRYGLVNFLCEPGSALETAKRLAATIAGNAPLAVRASRAVVTECTFADDSTGWEHSSAANDKVVASEDIDEGVRAFIEKRPPVWKGR